MSQRQAQYVQDAEGEVTMLRADGRRMNDPIYGLCPDPNCQNVYGHSRGCTYKGSNVIAEHVYQRHPMTGDMTGCMECGLSYGNPNARHISVQDMDQVITTTQDHISNAKASLTLAFGTDNVVERTSLLDVAMDDVILAQKANRRYMHLRRMLLDAGLI